MQQAAMSLTEVEKAYAEIDKHKLDAQARKLLRETVLYPFALAIGIATAVAALIAMLGRLA